MSYMTKKPIVDLNGMTPSEFAAWAQHTVKIFDGVDSLNLSLKLTEMIAPLIFQLESLGTLTQEKASTLSGYEAAGLGNPPIEWSQDERLLLSLRDVTIEYLKSVQTVILAAYEITRTRHPEWSESVPYEKLLEHLKGAIEQPGSEAIAVSQTVTHLPHLLR